MQASVNWSWTCSEGCTTEWVTRACCGCRPTISSLHQCCLHLQFAHGCCENGCYAHRAHTWIIICSLSADVANHVISLQCHNPAMTRAAGNFPKCKFRLYAIHQTSATESLCLCSFHRSNVRCFPIGAFALSRLKSIPLLESNLS